MKCSTEEQRNIIVFSTLYQRFQETLVLFLRLNES